MSLSQKFADFRRETARIRRVLDGSVPSRAKRGNRWNTIGRTRSRLAEILTKYVQSITGGSGELRYPDVVVLPRHVRPMRLVGRVRKWEDAFSWDAVATWPDGGVAATFFSFDTMTDCVRAGKIHPIGKDGEVGV